jgi:hypothetical protein
VGHALGTSCARNGAQFDLRLSECGRRRSINNITHHRQFTAPSKLQQVSLIPEIKGLLTAYPLTAAIIGFCTLLNPAMTQWISPTRLHDTPCPSSYCYPSTSLEHILFNVRSSYIQSALAELNAHLLSLDKDTDVDAIVFTGGDKVFAGKQPPMHMFSLGEGTAERVEGFGTIELDEGDVGTGSGGCDEGVG